MKNFIKQSLALFVLVAAFIVYNIPSARAQTKTGADALIGKWQNPDGSRRMEIYKNGNQYFGKIIWLKSNNDNVKIGDIVLKNIVFSNNQWTGMITAKGNEMNCSITMMNSNTINIKAKMGFISKSKAWARI